MMTGENTGGGNIEAPCLTMAHINFGFPGTSPEPLLLVGSRGLTGYPLKTGYVDVNFARRLRNREITSFLPVQWPKQSGRRRWRVLGFHGLQVTGRMSLLGWCLYVDVGLMCWFASSCGHNIMYTLCTDNVVHSIVDTVGVCPQGSFRD